MTAPITDPRELRHAALDAIRADPDSWTQSTWRCDTGMCFAGHIAVLAGGVFPYDPNDNGYVNDVNDLPVDRVEARLVVTAPDGTNHTISDFAGRVLGLPLEQMNVLFACDNTLTDLDRLVALLDEDDPITFSDIYPDFDDDLDEDDDEEGLGSL